jgi:ribonuclease HI
LAVVSGVQNLELRTDSEFVVDRMTYWIPRHWRPKGWDGADQESVVNRAELEELDAISRKINIRYVSCISCIY